MAGSRNDRTQAEEVIDKIRVAQSGPRRLRARSDRVGTDNGYSARTFRAYLRRRGIKATVPEHVDQLTGRHRCRETAPPLRQGRPGAITKRCFHRLKQRGGIATGYEIQPGRVIHNPW